MNHIRTRTETVLRLGHTMHIAAQPSLIRPSTCVLSRMTDNQDRRYWLATSISGGPGDFIVTDGWPDPRQPGL